MSTPEAAYLQLISLHTAENSP